MNYTLFNPLSKNGSLYQDNTNNYIDTTNNYLMNKLEQTIKINDTLTIIGGDGTLQYLVNHYPFILKYQIFYHKSGSGNDLYSALNQKGIYYYGINETNFLNSFGIGFDAIVCDNVNKAQNKGKLSYIKEAFLGIKNYKPFDLEVEYNNERHSYKNVWLCSLQNGNYFGGGLKIAKDANPHDKEIDLCIAHDVGRFMVLIILLFVKLGKVHLFKKYFLSLKVSDLKIYLKEERLAQFDGNTLVLNNTQTLKNKGHIDLEKTNIN